MKIIAVNGGPRANHNTAQLLDSAIEGAISRGAEVERFDLYKMDYKGCRGCFACKRKGSKSLFSCGFKDGLTPLLEAVAGADALLMASPVYFFDVTGELRSFLERLLFPYLPYDIAVEERTYFPRELQTALIYTMGAPEGMMDAYLKPAEDFLGQIFRVPPKTLKSSGCYPFLDGWEKYEVQDNLAATLAKRDETWEAQREDAFRFGAELAAEG